MNVQIATGLLLLFCMWSVLCRINKMQRGVTDASVIAGHLALGMGMAGGLFLPVGVGKLGMALGVALYLLAGAWQWRFAAPADTRADRGGFQVGGTE